MTTIKVAPAEKEGLNVHFEVVICDSQIQMSEWADNPENDLALFIPNADNHLDKENVEKLATIVLCPESINAGAISAQSARAGTMFAELMVGLLDGEFASDEEKVYYYRDALSNATEYVFNRIFNFVQQHYVGVPSCE